MSNNRKFRVIDRKFIPLTAPNPFNIVVAYLAVTLLNIPFWLFSVYVTLHIIVVITVVWATFNEERIQL
mgnify:FL=1